MSKMHGRCLVENSSWTTCATPNPNSPGFPWCYERSPHPEPKPCLESPSSTVDKKNPRRQGDRCCMVMEMAYRYPITGKGGELRLCKVLMVRRGFKSHGRRWEKSCLYIGHHSIRTWYFPLSTRGGTNKGKEEGGRLFLRRRCVNAKAVSARMYAVIKPPIAS
ncbi:hypothetical protein LZ30DRAFT_55215 [Colletotrichum cereale]|nr:hypothetical protein LZ30DRAFT_55215 [Colletotrichum cereale]